MNSSETDRLSPTRRWVVLIGVLLSAALALRLGFWQLDRAAQKLNLQQATKSRSALPPLPQSELAASADAAVLQYQRRVQLIGNWLPEATVFLDNRQIDGRPGFFVMTPLRLGDTSTRLATTPQARPVLIWVQRGWVARDNDDRTRLPDLPTPAGTVEVRGRLAPPPARLFEFAAETSGTIRQNLDIDASARVLGQAVLPMTLLQTEAASGAADGLLRDWPSPSIDVQKNYGYAFQWFALCALIVGLFVWFRIFRRIRPVRHEEA